MGAGAEQVVQAVAAAPENQMEAVAEATWIRPFRCTFEGCKEYLKNGASQAYVDSHMRTHGKLRVKADKKKMEKAANRAQKVLAAGPSSLRRLNRKMDTAAEQRSAAKAGKGNTGKAPKENAKGKAPKGNAKVKQAGGRGRPK